MQIFLFLIVLFGTSKGYDYYLFSFLSLYKVSKKTSMQSNQFYIMFQNTLQLSRSCLFTLTLSIFFDIVMISSIFFISNINKIEIGVYFFFCVS